MPIQSIGIVIRSQQECISQVLQAVKLSNLPDLPLGHDYYNFILAGMFNVRFHICFKSPL